MFRKQLDEGEAGDNVGLLLRESRKTTLKEDKLLQNPEVLLLIKNLKRKHTFLQKKKADDTLLFYGYRPQFILEQQT